MRARSLLTVPAVLATFLLAAAPPSDPAGSTEAQMVQRSCGAEADSHYDPPSGHGLDECKGADGQHDPNAEYTAAHYQNDVRCGTDDEIASGAHGASGISVSGDLAQEGMGGVGYLQVCNDGAAPVQGRFTLEGELGTGAQDATFTADGDKDNTPEQLQGWAQVKPFEQSVTCGKSYADGGRADAHNQTEGEASQENCG